jgi:hypothetical protein
MSWGEWNGFNLELAAAPTRLTLKSEIIVSETETAFAWLFGLALGAVFAGILLMKTLWHFKKAATFRSNRGAS